jgi:hypothetical protein
MYKSVFIFVLTTLLSLSGAVASSKYEKLKIMYEQGTSPISESNFINRVSSISSCAEFSSQSPNQQNSQSIIVVSHTIRGGGPEFPDEFFRGIGFLGADSDPEKFFNSYKMNLDLSGYSIQYDYLHTYSFCYDYPDGSSYCSGTYEVAVKSEAQFRVSNEYIIYKKEPDLYGYCWHKD